MRNDKYILASADSGVNMTVEAVENNGVADIRITDRISEWSDSSANSVRAKVDEMIAAGVSEARLYLNSQGGNVFQANEIINELKKFAKINITVGALAASAATRILAEFRGSAIAFQNSQFMIHKPKGYFDGNQDEIAASLQMLNNVTADYRTAYATCSGKTEDEIDALWQNGDYWMTAEQAQEFGLISSIHSDSKKLRAEDVALLEACGAPNIPKTEKTEFKYKMDKDKLKSLLGLAADATDEQIENAIAENKRKAEASAQTEAALQAQADERAEALVNDAILKDKKITADQKEVWLGLAKRDFEGAKAALEAMPEIGKLSEQISGNGKVRS
ncbi:MAG: ATP-dependent Clp protease proteolytic subunit, partial [Weeksellaceae bacterium]|nr:ATP-dependent Clp protease proteolytic subunit [Weeksellaceae bacterium]